MRITSMKAIDQHLGRLLCAILSLWPRKAQVLGSHPVQTIAVVKFWGLGSLVLLGPAIQRLRERYPGARIVLVTQKANREVLELLNYADEAWYLDLGAGMSHFVLSLYRLVCQLRRVPIDLLIDAEFLTRFSALLTCVSGAKFRVGFSVPEIYRGHFHDAYHPFNPHFHMVENFIALAEQNLTPANPPAPLPLLTPPKSAHQSLREKFPAKWKQAGERLIVVNPNAGELALERRWPPERFAELITALQTHHLGVVVLIGAPSERAYIGRLKAMLPDGVDQVMDLSGQTSLAELAALFSEASLLISNDTGPLHLACATGTPTVAIFGPETPVLFGPRNPRSRTLYQNLACSPCLTVHNGRTVRCPYARTHCVADISVQQVVAAAEELLHREIEVRPTV